MRIFLAEDDPIILSGFCMMIRALGHEVVGVATDGAEAAKKVLEVQPDLVLMDINMPKMDGISAIEACNREKIFPCIIITGYKDEEQIKRATVAGVYGYLNKPVDEYQLRAEISVVIERHKEHIRLEQELINAKNSLEERKIIERAKGIVMDKMNLKEADAFSFLQKKSRDKNMKLINVAHEIIKANELFK